MIVRNKRIRLFYLTIVNYFLIVNILEWLNLFAPYFQLNFAKIFIF